MLRESIVLNAIGALFVALLFGFLGAVFLNWSSKIFERRPVPYWQAYRITTFGSMAVIIFALPLQLLTAKWGFFHYLIDFIVSFVFMGIVLGHWLYGDDERPLGFTRALPISLCLNLFCVLLVGIMFGLTLMMAPRTVMLGAVLSLSSAALLYMAALSAARPAPAAAPIHPERMEPTMAAVDEDYAALREYAVLELDHGKADATLWLKASTQHESAEDRREWYLAMRVQALRRAANEQLRREQGPAK